MNLFVMYSNPVALQKLLCTSLKVSRDVFDPDFSSIAWHTLQCKTFPFIYRQIRNELENQHTVYITATTGMARLQFVNAMTIHHWSGYGDGHKDINHLVEQILTNPAYEDIKQRILKCEVLIIDEIGLLSCKAFDDIEFISRNICKSEISLEVYMLLLVGHFCNYYLYLAYLMLENMHFKVTCSLKHSLTKLNWIKLCDRKSLNLLMQ